jgi:hypothetical protein
VFSIAFYTLSLFLPVFQCGNSVNWLGYDVLLEGWLGIFTLDPRWALNIVFFCVVYSNLPINDVPRDKTISKLLILGALSTLIIPACACGNFGNGLSYSSGLALGGYFWVLALITAGLSSFIRKSNNDAAPNNSAKP